MGKKLAIKGHPTRGNEVIKLLEMMGGDNRDTQCRGIEVDFYYYIDTYGHINYDDCLIEDEANFFTLEEFLEKYPYKIGDKVTALFQSDKRAISGFCSIATVTIKSMRWSEDCKTMVYDFEETEGVFCAEDLEPYKEESNIIDKEDKLFDSIIWHLRNSVNNDKQNLSGGECEDYFREVVKKNNENKMKNVLTELLEHIKITSKEELEREFEEIKEWSNVGPTVEEFRTFCECVNRKPKYPKLTNLTECKEILGEKDMYQGVSGYKGELLTNFQRLLIFRDAYWKIAGEQMGLGKPWEPDWTNLDQLKYCIMVDVGEFITTSKIRGQEFLNFPTEEMRDIFYENFRDLIEQCKELL